MMPVYEGTRSSGNVVVIVDGQALDPRLDLCNHSPTGFEYGYSGSGPAQLALAILCHHFEHVPAQRIEEVKRLLVDEGYVLDDKITWPEWLAIRLHQPFKAAMIAGLPQDSGFTLTSEQVDAAVTALVQKL